MKWSAVCIVTVFAFVAGGPIMAGQQQPEPTMASDSTKKSSIERMKLKALAGDRAAARDLPKIYAKIDFNSMQYWNLIGSENGDPVAQYNYALLLFEKGDRFDKERAVFWLRKAAATNDTDAVDLLRELETRLKQEK